MEEPLTNGSAEPIQNNVENGVSEKKDSHSEKKEHRGEIYFSTINTIL